MKNGRDDVRMAAPAEGEDVSSGGSILHQPAGNR